MTRATGQPLKVTQSGGGRQRTDGHSDTDLNTDRRKPNVPTSLARGKYQVVFFKGKKIYGIL
jgi:hypothetical protein